MYINNPCSSRVTISNLSHTWRRTTSRRLLRSRVSTTQAEIADTLNKITSNGVDCPLWCEKSRTLRSSLLHLKQTDPSSIPYANCAGCCTCRRTYYHLAGENEAPEKRLVPAHREGGPLKRLSSCGGWLGDDALDLGFFRKGWKVGDQSAALRASRRPQRVVGDMGRDGGDDGEDCVQGKFWKPGLELIE